MTRIEIVGHVGIEKHVLVDRLGGSGRANTTKEIASNIIAIKNALGGSATFANTIARQMGVVTSLITSIGVDDHLARRVLQYLGKLNNGECKIIRRGVTNLFVSIWEQRSGRKQLYCRISSNILTKDIAQCHAFDLDAVILYGVCPRRLMG